MMTMGERMGDNEIDEIVGDSDLVNNEYISIEDFAKMIMIERISQAYAQVAAGPGPMQLVIANRQPGGW